jgi:BON domain
MTAAMTGTIAAGMEILTAAAVTYDQIGGTRTGKKLIDRKSLWCAEQENKTFKTSEENFMIRTIKNVAGTLVVLFLMSGCQAMTGETMGQNLDDGALTSSVKTKLASDKLVTLSRVGVETNNGIVYLTGEVETGEQKSHIGSVSSQVSGVKKVVNNLQVIKR